MSDELKPCLRCGHDTGALHSVVDQWAGDENTKMHCVQCGDCDIRTYMHEAEEEAIADWNIRPDPWTLTADKLPEEGVPVWTQGDSGIDTCQQGHFATGLGWFFCTRPPVSMNGRWHLYGASQEMGVPPKRWRYMLGP